MGTTVWKVLSECHSAVAGAVPTVRSADDKEFHFQRWVEARIRGAGFLVPETGRNTYPDFPVDGFPEAYEVKGITQGSRERDFDCNSTLPEGTHGGKHVFYLFGRYEGPKAGASPKVLDIAIVHGSFLNAGGGAISANSSFRGLGSYGDVLLRARKMFVARTPYGLLTNLRDSCTLVLPEGWETGGEGFVRVGTFQRREVKEDVVGYSENFLTADLKPITAAHSRGVRTLVFEAWRTASSSDTGEVAMEGSIE